ncbi:cytoplasmic tRNA 2-thiolation protein 2 isoform X4 [Octodon degus]|uniref:Cytoplasmic tRNA 2-thiolation protein 2 n=1 Tax=Octodon degus TaxID=10160 RepID=A0A6P6DMQ3_OCTDE|nr:cytoplasmic tRNA 2-thiolation protein 2 isoform X4 [Octodon degus]
MCQVGEDYVDPPPRECPPAPRPGRGQKCVKCKEGKPVVAVRAGDAFCRDCFKAFYIHKFRAMLGKNRLIFPGEKVLLAWSGGPSSSSMVWQVLEGLSQHSAKRLRFVPGVVYVDEGAVCGQSLEDRAKTLAEVQQILCSISFPWHVVSLEEVFSLPPSVLRYCPQDLAGTEGAYKAAVDSFLQQQHALRAEGAKDVCGLAPGEEERCWRQSQDPHGPLSLAGSPTAAQTEALCRLFESVRTLTAKEELLQMLRSHLILHVARAHSYSKVMTGDSCTRLAIKLMTNLALGRGAFLAWDTLWTLRLQAQFPSTVSTVYRTSEKLAKAPRESCAEGPQGPRCLLCLCTLDIDAADSATAFGVQTSALSQMPPSTLQAEAGIPTTPCSAVGGGPGCCGKACGREGDSQPQVIKQLCYSCRANMKDLPSLDPLPPYILAEAQLRSQRAWVMQDIQEYLIKDSADEAETTES